MSTHRRARAHFGAAGTLPWLRAPLLLVRRPVVFVAILAASAILSIAAASGPLFLSTVGTASLAAQAKQTCPENSLPGLSLSVKGRQVERAATASAAALRKQGLAAPRVVTVGEATVQKSLVHLFAGPDALANVRRLTPSAGSGVWVPDTFARKLDLRPGATFATTSGADLRVAGIYRDLAPDPFALANLPRYWCSWTNAIVATVASDSAVAATGAPNRQGVLLITDRATVARAVEGPVRVTAHSPMSTDTAALGAFVTAADRADAAAADPTLAGGRTMPSTELRGLTTRAATARDGLSGSIVPVEIAGVVIAGLLVGGAGMFWANARRREIRLLVARGVGPGALAGKAVLETGPPAIIGAVLGWLATTVLVKAVGPAQVFEAGATLGSLTVVAGTLVLGLLLIAVIGALAGRERTTGRSVSWLVRVPWELALLAAAAVIAVANLNDRAVVVERAIVKISPLVVLYPLLGATGALLLLGRLVGALLPSAGRGARRGPTAWYLALRRMSRSRAVAVGLIVGTALPVCLLMYGTTVRDTVSREVTDKYRTNLGAPHVLQIYGVHGALIDLDGAGSQVVSYDQDVTLGDEPASVLGVDPKTFAQFAFLSAGQRSDLRSLRTADAGTRVPAIVVNAGGDGSTRLRISRTALALDPVATSAVFPGLRTGTEPLVVVDQRTLGRVDDGTERTNQIWTDDAHYGAARRVVVAGRYSLLFELTSRVVVDSTGLLPVTWAFGYLQALAILIGVVAVAGLVFGLASRTRSRRVAYVLSRRMGMSRLAHVNSLLIELGLVIGLGWVAGSALGVGSFGFVLRRLDVYPRLPPAPAFSVPLGPLAVTAAIVVGVVVLATLATQALAERTRPAEILRLE